MRNFYAVLFISFAGLAGISGCNIINPSEVVPTYVHIDSFTFKGRDTLGSSSHKITNVYVYFNNAPVGVFDLPVTFPVIATQAGTITVLPGIDFDGLTGYETNYPMYNGDTMHLVPDPGNTVTYTPKAAYSTGVVRRFLEAFEDGTGKVTSFSVLSGDTGLLVSNNPPDVFEGKGSGVIRLTAPGLDSTTIISTKMEIPPSVNSYIELDYKGNVFLYVGMSVMLNTGTAYTEYMIALKPRTDWGKIYIGLRDFVSTNQGTDYQVILKMLKPSDVADGSLFLDNIKVLSF